MNLSRIAAGDILMAGTSSLFPAISNPKTSVQQYGVNVRIAISITARYRARYYFYGNGLMEIFSDRTSAAEPTLVRDKGVLHQLWMPCYENSSSYQRAARRYGL